MIESATDLASTAGLRPPIETQLSRHAAVMIVASFAAVATGWGGCVAIAAAASLATLWRYRVPSPALPLGGMGLADALTSARLVVLVLAAASLPWAPAGWILAAFAFNVAVDAIDGYAARKLGGATRFGAVLDREVDAVFVLVAYLYFHLTWELGAWMLVAGLLPYFYRLLVTAASTPIRAGSKERIAAPLAGLNFLLLLAASAAPASSSSILGISVAVVCASFGASFWSLYRHAHPLS